MGGSVSVPESLTRADRTEKFQAVVAGATGASGRWVVKELLKDEQCVRVVALTRRPLSEPAAVFFDTEKTENLVISDFSKFPNAGDFVPGVAKVAVVAMGSAPYSEEADFTKPVEFGRLAKSFGVSRCALVSAVGAKAGSIFGYVDTIGRREDAFKAMEFPDGLVIFRPKLLLRQESKRTKEKILECFSPDSQCIDTRDMAKIIVKSLKAASGLPLVATIEHAEMKAFLERSSACFCCVST